MDITNNRMSEPTNGYNYVDHIIQFIKDIAPFGSAIWISKVVIDRFFKERRERHEARYRQMAREELAGELATLKHMITSLTEEVGVIKQHLKP